MQLFNTLIFIINHPLNKKRKIKSILTFFKWQIGCRLLPGNYIFNWIDDSKIIARKGESSVTGQIYCGLYTFSEMSFILHVLRTDDLFIDIGSNIGCYTILASAVKGARGYCFEPVPSTFARLNENLRLNNITDRVKAFNLGIAEKDDMLAFTTDKNTTNLVVSNGKSNSNNIVLVKVDTLDRILIDESPTLLKIDVEGYETKVLEGAINILKKQSLNSVIIRLKGHGARYGYDERDIFKTMKTFGFSSYLYNPFQRELQLSDNVNPLTGNAIFIRNLPLIKTKIAEAPKINVSGLSF